MDLIDRCSINPVAAPVHSQIMFKNQSKSVGYIAYANPSPEFEPPVKANIIVLFADPCSDSSGQAVGFTRGANPIIEVPFDGGSASRALNETLARLRTLLSDFAACHLKVESNSKVFLESVGADMTATDSELKTLTPATRNALLKCDEIFVGHLTEDGAADAFVFMRGTQQAQATQK